MRQSTTPEQMANLSPVAKQRLNDWLKVKDYGSIIDGEFIPMVQLSIGVMIEFLDEHKFDEKHNEISARIYRWETENKDELCDALFDAVREILEQKN